ncbi:DUF58 domain-containing protein [Thalassotalea sp. HSM 43]|uniref:DUF58 domain-containing protein n=1 Tax=Thalassotalea sp. HSM 43 TaxID=2552945 RepID=UPI001E578F90|nr:DUF58 domain-containing protein [Thalassotalea sp. HSM 43]
MTSKIPQSIAEENIYTSIEQLRRMQYLAKGFSLLPQQPVNSVLAGHNASKLRGRGLNFEELRHYRPGDDIRSMDWKVTRRTGKPHIKVYTEERERNVYLAIDQRSSMFFGSTGKMKSVIAAEIAALFAWRVVDSGDRVGAIVYNDNKQSFIPAKRGRAHVVNLLSSVVKRNNELKVGKSRVEPQQSFDHMLAKLSQVCGQNALVVFIGDGYGWSDSAERRVKSIRQHNEIIYCHISDHLEQQLPSMSQMVVSDGEKQIQFSSMDKQIQHKYKASLQQQLNAYSLFARKYRIPLISIDTLQPAEKQLYKALGGQ